MGLQKLRDELQFPLALPVCVCCVWLKKAANLKEAPLFARVPLFSTRLRSLLAN